MGTFGKPPGFTKPRRFEPKKPAVYLLCPLCMDLPPPREGGLTIPPPRGAGLIILPPRGGGTDMPVPREGGAAILLPRDVGAAILLPGIVRARGPLKILLSLLGTPVEIKPLVWETPIPAKVLPLNLVTGSMRNTLCRLTSLKWFETNATLLSMMTVLWKSFRMKKPGNQKPVHQNG